MQLIDLLNDDCENRKSRKGKIKVAPVGVEVLLWFCKLVLGSVGSLLSLLRRVHNVFEDTCLQEWHLMIASITKLDFPDLRG